MSVTKEQALLAVDREKDKITGTSDKIWGTPETAFQEFQSVQALCELLEEEGFQVEKNVAGIATAFSGRFGKGTPVIGILGEFDALSGLSQKEAVAEKIPLIDGEPGHGCGHNLLGAASVGAAVAVKEYLEKNGKEGTVVFFGCPGEEGGSGKSFMAREGVFDGLDCAISWHPDDLNRVWCDSSLANYQVIYRFYGVAAHAAGCPELGRSALDAVELMNTGVQYLREHVIQEARIHYAITNTGGYSPNVVQPFAEVMYLMRAPKLNQVKEIFERINDIAKGAALMTGTRMELQFVKACSNIVCNTALSEVLQKNLETVAREPYTEEELKFAGELMETYGGHADRLSPLAERYEKARRDEVEKLFDLHKNDTLNDFIVPLMDAEIVMAGSTDVGDVSWVCPTAQIGTVTASAGTPGHSWQQVTQGRSSAAHKGELFASKVMGAAVIDLFESPETVAKAKDELKKRLGGVKYENPIPKDVKPMAINPASK